jgi:hypothetical protein
MRPYLKIVTDKMKVELMLDEYPDIAKLVFNKALGIKTRIKRKYYPSMGKF